MPELLPTRGPYRVVAVDLDGTLLRSDGTISARTRSVLQRAEQRGLAVISVTARPPRRVRQIATAVGLRGLSICSNGSVLYEVATERLLREERLALELISELVRRLRAEAPGVAFAIEAGAQYGCEQGYLIEAQHLEDTADPQRPPRSARHGPAEDNVE